MFNLARNQSDQTCRNSTCLVPSVIYVAPFCKSCADEKKKVSGCSEWLQLSRIAGLKGSQGTTGTAGLRKMVQNRKAVCFTLDELPT
jgi:hypothetical protein